MNNKIEKVYRFVTGSVNGEKTLNNSIFRDTIRIPLKLNTNVNVITLMLLYKINFFQKILNPFIINWSIRNPVLVVFY